MKIVILGGGVEGITLACYFSEKKADVSLYDKNFVDLKKSKLPYMKTKFGPHYLDNIEKCDFIFRSPGIPFFTSKLQKAIKKGAKITSLTKYFFEKCPCPIIGVTGTKGKGTVATLLYEILKAAGRSVYLGGNIGVPPLEFLDKLEKTDTVILELSSFQLQDLDQSPHIAIILPISEDHLDYHKTFKEYIEAKKNIVRFQKKGDIAIANINNKISASFFKETKGETREVSVKDDSRNKFLETQLIGEHNMGNILIAATAASALGVPMPVIQKAVKNFKGLPHRLEFVREAGGVKFYNDSASTNPETCIAALRAFSQPTILIAGGSEKHLDYTALGKEIISRANVKIVVLMGQTKKRIEKAIDKVAKNRSTPLEIIMAENYHEAFMAAKALSRPDDVILFSPASASFDMFKNYQERGEAFKRWVLSL